MLLSTCNSSSSSTVDVEQSNSISEYLRRVSGQEREKDVISIDHGYSKYWNNHPNAHHTKPARLLFMKNFQRSDPSLEVSDVPLDVESFEEPVVAPFNNQKNRVLSEECDQFLANSLPCDISDEKDNVINKAGWTASQKNLYKHVMKLLHGNRLSRLANSGASSELIKRRANIDKGASRMRRLFASNTWDMKLLGWLHRTLLDHLSVPLLSEYCEILKALKTKVPSLVDKMMSQFGSFHLNLFGASSAEAFVQLIRKQWDPVTSTLCQHKPNKLPGNPVIVVVPSSPNQTMANQSQRMRLWNSYLSSLAKVVQLPVHTSLNVTVEECLNQIFTLTRNKVVEVSGHSPKRPTILVGWNVASLIACHVALEEPVTAVVCLGFPMKGLNGTRGDLDDPLLDSKVPMLFVIGQSSATCELDDIEAFREKMKAETGLVVIGGADDSLRISNTKKITEGITQLMVDRCLVDEIAAFLIPILNHLGSGSSAAPLVTSKKTTFVEEKQVVEDGKRPRKRPREYSPEIPAVKKKPRPVGRPSMQKVLSSGSSSDSSSFSSFANASPAKKDKKLELLKQTKLLSRQQMLKNNFQRHFKATNPVAKKEKLIDEAKANAKETMVSPPPHPPPPPPPPPQPSTSTKVNPAKILAEQQKNGPVDVEKAFGKDSSFLPRPLTPAEFDGNESVVSPTIQVEKPSELIDQGAVPENKDILPSLLNTPTASSKSVISVSLSSILGSPERQKISYLKTSIGNYPLTAFSTHVSSTVAIQKPQVVAKISEPIFDSKTCIMPVQKLQATDVSVSSASLCSVSSQTKILKNNGSGTNIKHMQGLVTLAGKGLLTSSSATPSKAQTIFVGPQTGNKPATFLVQSSEASSSPAGKIQFRKMLVQGSSKHPLFASSEEGKSSLSEQPCNLSLLSDVAGMKEPIRQMVHDAQNVTSATLVKLASSNKMVQPPVKRIRVIETMPSSSSTSLQRQETPEELAEKQMAIRALSSSLNEESDSGFSYNIQSSKMDPNFMPRSSSMLGYSVVMPRPRSSLPTRTIRRGRGRSLAGFPMTRKPRVQRFYPF